MASHRLLGLVHVKRWEKRNRNNFYWKRWEVVEVIKLILLAVDSIWYLSPKCYVWRLSIVQKLYKFYQFFLYGFFAPKCFCTPNPQIIYYSVHITEPFLHQKIYLASYSQMKDKLEWVIQVDKLDWLFCNDCSWFFPFNFFLLVRIDS